MLKDLYCRACTLHYAQLGFILTATGLDHTLEDLASVLIILQRETVIFENICNEIKYQSLKLSLNYETYVLP